MGDSISTYSGTIPSGNANYYTDGTFDISSVDQIWWKHLIDSLGMTLEVNNSWSGLRVTTTNGVDSAGVTRASMLGTSLDVIIVYIGINVFNNEVELGAYNWTGELPTRTTTFREAYAVMLNSIMETYPNANVFCATLLICERNGSVGEPPEKK